MLEAFALLCMIYVGNPRWVASYVCSFRYWLKYYEVNTDKDRHNAIVRFRAKNIVRLRKAKFKAMK